MLTVTIIDKNIVNYNEILLNFHTTLLLNCLYLVLINGNQYSSSHLYMVNITYVYVEYL